MKNKSIVLIMILALMLTLTACGKSEFGLSENDGKQCGKSEFGLSENDGKHMTITARNADRDAFFMVGSLDVADGEQIEIAANLTKGSVRVEIVAGAGGGDPYGRSCPHRRRVGNRARRAVLSQSHLS